MPIAAHHTVRPGWHHPSCFTNGSSPHGRLEGTEVTVIDRQPLRCEQATAPHCAGEPAAMSQSPFLTWKMRGGPGGFRVSSGSDVFMAQPKALFVVMCSFPSYLAI